MMILPFIFCSELLIAKHRVDNHSGVCLIMGAVHVETVFNMTS
jgi:hypothetical protein